MTTNGRNGHGFAQAADSYAANQAQTGWYSILRPRGNPSLHGLPSDPKEALKDVVHNALSTRADWLRRYGDPRRDIEDECGYPRLGEGISADLYRVLYDRDAIANRVVQVMPKESWQGVPKLYEDEDEDNVTKFEEGVDDVNGSLNAGGGGSWLSGKQGTGLWEMVLQADVLSGIGHFGILLLGLDDGRALQDPVEGAVQVEATGLVPVYRDVPKRNADGVPLLNAAGDGWLTERRQVGARRTLTTVPLRRDSAPAPDEAAALDNLIASGAFPGRRVAVLNGRYAEEPVSHPARYLNGWRPTPEPVNEDRPAARSATPWPPDPTNPPTENKGPTFKKDDRPQAGFGSGGNGPTSAATDSAGRPLFGTAGDRGGFPATSGSSLYGTDAQYDQYYNPAAPQQYLGFQAGPSEQLADKPKAKKHKLLYLRAFSEDLVQIVRYEWNPANPRFGQPVLYRVTLNDPREQHSGVGLPLATVFVHWTRVVHYADKYQTPNSSPVFAPPRQRAVLNNILGGRKIYGAGPEGYWQSCFTGISFETNPQLGGDVDVDEGAMKDHLEQYFNGLQRYLLGVGMTAKTLSPSVVDPTPHVAAQIEAICIQLSIPVRVFKGSERGELASSQDDASWNDRLRSRQNYYITPHLIAPLIDRLIMVGVLPEPESYTVEWPDLDSLTDSEKAAVLLQKTQAYAAALAGGVFDVVPKLDYMTRFDDFSNAEAQEILDASDQEQEQQDQEDQDLADKHGFEPEPPEGFQKPEPEPPPEPPAPVKLRGGETLVHPATGKTVAKGPPRPPAANANPEGPASLNPPTARFRQLLRSYDEDELDGLGAWYNPAEGKVIVDRMDWYGGGQYKDRPADPATALVRLARQVGADVEEQNEGGRPDPADGWVDLVRNVKATKGGKLTGGRWVTTEEGHHLYIKDGKPVAGNPHVIAAAEGERPPDKPTAEEYGKWLDKGWEYGPNGWEPPTVQPQRQASPDVPADVHAAAAGQLSDAGRALVRSAHGWEQSKPWNASEDDVKAGKVPGIKYTTNPHGEEAHFQGGVIHLSPKFFRPPMSNHEEARRHVVYHELGHQLADTMVHDGTSFQLHDAGVIPAKHDLGSGTGGGHGDEEALADAYALLHTDPSYLRKHHPQLEGPVVARARALGMPVPKGVANAKGGCGTGAGGFKPGNTCGRGGGGGTVTTKRGETLHALEKDADGKWTLPGGGEVPEHARRLLVPGWREAHYNPDPKGTLLVRGVDAKGRLQNKYGDGHKARQAAAKFGRVRELIKKRAEIYKELERDAKDPALRDRAECLSVVMRTGMRPGSTKDTKADHKSYGATTLEGRHVVVGKDGSVTLRLVTGKNKGREVDFPVGDKATADMLKARAKAAGSGGRLFDVDAPSLRLYSKDKDGGGFKTKDHRTALGTETAAAAVKADRGPPPTTEREYKDRTMDVARQVSKVLGNTPPIALKDYIDPKVFAPWRKAVGL